MLEKLRNAALLVVGGLVAFWAVTALVGVVQGGDMDPPGTPGPTMLPLDEMPPAWHQILAANDGAAGPDPPAGCNSSRFQCVMNNNEAVLDKETGLVWERLPDRGTNMTWAQAMDGCQDFGLGDRKGWRLATVEELTSLLDLTTIAPALPSGHPFDAFPSDNGYWTATTDHSLTTSALMVTLYYGDVGSADKTWGLAHWCVRGGHGHDGY